MVAAKTHEGWPAGVGLTQYLQPGDVVDETMRVYFQDTLPPITWRDRALQLGEPYDGGGPGGASRYATLVKSPSGKWFYMGLHPSVAAGVIPPVPIF